MTSDSSTTDQECSPGTPLVSVIVPTYNRAILLQAAIASILCQSWTTLEVVVVDDGSTDSTPAVVMEAAEKDKRVRYLRRKNGGVSAARNTGLANARGDLIAFLDSDDIWMPWKLAAQVAALQSLPRDVGMIWTDMDAIAPDGSLKRQRYLRTMYSAYQRISQADLFAESASLSQLNPTAVNHGDLMVYWGQIYPQMLFGNLVHTSTVLLRRERAEQVGRFDESLRCGEDYKYHLATTRLGRVAFLDVPSILYRIGAPDQFTSAKYQVDFATAFLKTIEDELANHSNELSSKTIAGIRADAHDWLAMSLFESGQRSGALRHALAAIGQRLNTLNAWKTLIKVSMPSSAVRLVRRAKKTSLGKSLPQQQLA